MSSGIPYFFRIHQSDGRWTLSNAFLKSIKFIITGLFHAVTFSIICRRINIWSLQDLYCLNPACSWRSWLSIAFLILPSRTLLKTLPGTDNRVIPRQLLQSVFGSGMIIPFLHSDGIFLVCHMSLHSFVSTVITAVEYFRSSGCIWSTPAAFPFF